MAQSLTDWLQQSRLIVVGVDPITRSVRVKNEPHACTDLSCSERTLVVTDEGVGHSSRRAQRRRHRASRRNGRASRSGSSSSAGCGKS